MSYIAGFGFYLHGLSCLALIFGLVLLAAWMVKTLNVKKLLTWSLILIAAGVFGLMIGGMSFGGSYDFRGMMNSNYFQQYNSDFR